MTGTDETQLGDDFSYIIRIADTDVDGLRKISVGLCSIKGIGMRTAEMRYPSCTTTTFLNNHLNPTVILDSYVGKHENELGHFPPTEAVYTVPMEGSFLTHKPYYIHGVFPGDDLPRVTLEYDVWEEQPENRRRLGIKSSIFDCHFMKQPLTEPILWLGQTTSLTSSVPSTRVSLKRPTYFNEGDFWRVSQ